MGEGGGMTRCSSRQSSPVLPVLHFSDEGRCVHVCPLLDVVTPAFPWSSSLSAALECSLQDGLGHGVVACHMAEPLHLPSLGDGEQWFLCAGSKLNLVAHRFICPVLSPDLQESAQAQTLHLEGFDFPLKF